MDAPDKTCGVLGGMGPEATVYLLSRIIANTDAGEDGEHVHCLINQNPQVPSRIKAVLEGGEDPGPILQKMAGELEAAGADFLCMPCNTAHLWLEEIGKKITKPFLNMPGLACQDAARASQGRKCGILGTTATRDKRLYDPYCAQKGMEAIYPDDEDQADLLAVINEVKGGDHSGQERLAKIAANLADLGASVMILACTELSVLGLPEQENYKVIDALESLAQAIVKEAGARPK